MAHDAGELSDAIPLCQEFLESSPTDNGQGRLKWIMVSSLALVVGVFAGAATVGYSQGQRSYLMKADDVYTTGGAAHENSHCHFPFGWKDVWYNECTEVDSARPGVAWCSVDDDDAQPDHSNAWGYCKPVPDVPVFGGEGTGTPDQYVALNDPAPTSAPDEIFPSFGGEGTGTPDQYVALNDPAHDPALDEIYPSVGGEGTGTPQQEVQVYPVQDVTFYPMAISDPSPPPGELKGGNGDAGVDNPLNCCFTCGYIWCLTLGPVGVGKCVKVWEEPCPTERGADLVVELPMLAVKEKPMLPMPKPTALVVRPDEAEIAPQTVGLGAPDKEVKLNPPGAVGEVVVVNAPTEQGEIALNAPQTVGLGAPDKEVKLNRFQGRWARVNTPKEKGEIDLNVPQTVGLGAPDKEVQLNPPGALGEVVVVNAPKEKGEIVLN